MQCQDPKDFKILTLLGRCILTNTDIYSSVYVPKNQLLSLRCTDVDSCSTDVLELLQHELWISRILNHANILTFCSTFIEQSKLYVTAPLMEYGSCADMMFAHFKYGLPEIAIAAVLRDILKALTYIHSMRYIHRGLKGSHILISKAGEVKLGGLRHMVELVRNGVHVSKVHNFPKHDTSLLPWLSPEILQQNMQGYGCKSDIYSLGITACELANGHAPFIDMPSTQMLLEKLSGTIPFLLDKSTVPDNGEVDNYENLTMSHEVTRASMTRVACSRIFSLAFHQLIKECLEKDAEFRPLAKDLMKHPFFKQLKNQSNFEVFQPVFAELIPLGNMVQEDTQEPENSEVMLKEVKNLSLTDVEWDFVAM